jgi:hypothetical protein
MEENAIAEDDSEESEFDRSQKRISKAGTFQLFKTEQSQLDSIWLGHNKNR